MQERDCTAIKNVKCEPCHERAGVASSAACRVHADRADFRESGHALTLSRHGDQRTIDTNTEVAAHFDRAWPKRTGPCRLRKAEHRRHIISGQLPDVGPRRTVYSRRRVAKHHLQEHRTHYCDRSIDLAKRRQRRERQRFRCTQSTYHRRDQFDIVPPDGREGCYLRRVSPPIGVELRQMGLRAAERRPSHLIKNRRSYCNTLIPRRVHGETLRHAAMPRIRQATTSVAAKPHRKASVRAMGMPNT